MTHADGESSARWAAAALLLALAATGGCGGEEPDRPLPASVRTEGERTRARFYEKVQAAARSKRAGDFPGARAHLESALEVDPDHEGSLVELAHVLRLMGRRDEALGVLETLRQKHPDLPRSHGLLAELLADDPEAARKDLQRARALYRHALAMEPNIAGPRLGLARVERRLGALDDAEKSYRTVLGTDPQSVPALVGLAATLLDRGRANDAVPLLVQALELGTRAKGRRDVPSEMDTQASFASSALTAPQNRPALDALRRAARDLGSLPKTVPAPIRAAVRAGQSK